MSRLFRNTLLIVFIVALMIIVFLQYGSDYNIRQLIVGNENLLTSLQLKNNLQKVQTGIVALESKVRGAIIRGQNIDTNHLKEELKIIRETIAGMDTLETDSVTFSLLTELKNNIEKRTFFYTTLLDTFRINGKLPAEKMANAHPGRFLSDSLRALVFKIDSVHERQVISLIRIADKNTSKAKTLSTILSLIAILVCLFTFGYISYKVKEQQLLIEKLNDSEKKIKDAIRVKEKFLANMSHEIRTPLNSILGFTELLEKQALSGEQGEFIHHIKSSGDSLYKIVNDILDTSKIEAGMMRIESVPFRLGDVIYQVDGMFNNKFAEKEIGWIIHVDPEVPDDLIGDPTRLSQILNNILSNALKFTMEGMVRLDITASTLDKQHVFVYFVINDSGIGISNETQGNLFERFQQADDTITRKYGGSGLGLAITKELVDLMEGFISLESYPGQGSTFTVKLPYKINQHSLPADPKYSNTEKQTNHKNGQTSILVVEDNITNQVLIKHMLSQHQMRCDVASNGLEAMNWIKKSKYDIVLMDIQMPEMDGYTAAKRIREDLKLDIPVIAMTAFAFENEKDNWIKSGMNDYVSKPIKLEELLGIIYKYTRINEHKMDNINAGKPGIHPTSVVDMNYMESISPGDEEFKQHILGQFIAQAPAEIAALEGHLNTNEIHLVKKAAHNLKSTFSIAGPDSEVHKILESIESCTVIDESIYNNLTILKKLSRTALEEAAYFLKSPPFQL